MDDFDKLINSAKSSPIIRQAIAEFTRQVYEECLGYASEPEDCEPCECGECRAERAEQEIDFKDMLVVEGELPVDIEDFYGWLCPRCLRSNAPWLPYCDCGVMSE
jgi:hypothetical protein